jgi:hypothetical protein
MGAIMAAATHHGGLIWGIVLVVIGSLHLAFRRFYARRSAAVESARKETAPGPLKGRAWYVTGQRTNMIWVVGSSVVFIAVGAALIAANAS